MAERRRSRTGFLSRCWCMAGGQLRDLSGFRAVQHGYKLGSLTSSVLAGAFPVIELLGGMCLLVRRGVRVGSVAALGAAATWAGLAVSSYARCLVVRNGDCFGLHLAQPLRWWVLVEDAWLVWLSALIGIRSRHRGAHALEPVRAELATVSAIDQSRRQVRVRGLSTVRVGDARRSGRGRVWIGCEVGAAGLVAADTVHDLATL